MTPARDHPQDVDLVVDGRLLRAPAGTTVAAALVNAGLWIFRASVGGEPRGPLCGMGVCFECRLTIDGVPQQRACLAVVRPGMHIATGGTRG